MQILTVDLGDRSYPITIGSGLLKNSQLLTDYIQGKRVVIVTNTTIAPLYLESVQALLKGYSIVVVMLPDGEEYKQLNTIDMILTQMLEAKCDRKSTVLALGGGVIGDMTGFAASCYQRGVHFIQIPTTLLAQVDSSVGGKTGVNHLLGKNMIGAFYQPQSVIIDIDTLKTLDKRQFSAGMAEVIKYGLLWDRYFLKWLEDNMKGLMNQEEDLLSYAIHRSCEIKAEVVSQDEKELGVRALLNLGHTFGHAIENQMGYGQWLHGEAVGVGMVMAAEMSQLMGWLSDEEVAETKQIIQRAGLPIKAPSQMTVERFLEAMSIDKKVQEGVMHLILMRSLGEALSTSDFSREQLVLTIQKHLKH